jgi:protein-disulfide isomerase
MGKYIYSLNSEFNSLYSEPCIGVNIKDFRHVFKRTEKTLQIYHKIKFKYYKFVFLRVHT